MAIKYGKFELPEKIKIEESTKGLCFARFVAEPLERGFGHTVGNALRRVMLGALEAPSIISFRIAEVPHEFMAIEGVLEDVTHIILNLKNALLRRLPSTDEPRSRESKLLSKLVEVSSDQIQAGGGQYVVTLKDIFESPDFEIVSPDLPIFTCTRPFSRKIDIRVAFGRGYVPSERHIILEPLVDEIVIDSSFSPVRMVNYFVENTRVGQDTDFDKLILEVKTDGRLSPEEAITFATQIAMLHFSVFENLVCTPISFDKDEIQLDTDRDALLAKLALKINEIELSVRSTNCLASANIGTIAELVIMPESELLKFRNFGKKSLNEIKAKLEEMSLGLGMDLAVFGITRDNVRQVIQEYLEEKIG